MNYGILSFGKVIGAVESGDMKVKMLGVLRESVTFAVDGKEVMVPREIEPGDSVHDMVQHFMVGGAQYISDGSDVLEDARAAIAKFISDEFTPAKVKFTISNE